MKIDFEGRTWSYDADDITVQDAEVIEKETGAPVIEWSRSLAGIHAGAYKILYWLMRSQSGDPIPLGEVNFRLYPFVTAFTDAAKAEAEAVAAASEADPTVPPPTQAGDSQPPVPPPGETLAAPQPG